jgi:hypothetical protein
MQKATDNHRRQQYSSAGSGEQTHIKRLNPLTIASTTRGPIGLILLTLMLIMADWVRADVIPGTSLTPTVWWDAGATNNILSNSISFTNPVVIQLTDRSGNGHNAVVSGSTPAPTFVTNDVNGLPALNFPDNAVLISPTGATTGNSSHSIFVVASYVASSGQFRCGAVFYSGSAGTGQNSTIGVVPSSSIAWVGGYGQDNAPYVGVTPLDGAGFNVLGKIYDSSVPSYTGYVAGSVDVSTTAGIAYNLGGTDVGIGRQFNTGSYWNGDIAEVVVFNSALGYTDELAVQQYLANKYHLPLTVALPNILLSTPRAYPEIGSNLSLTVALPPHLTNAVTINIANDNSSVLGFTSTNVTFAAGGTNVMTISTPILGAGTANLTASAGGFNNGTLVVGGAPAETIAEVFQASSTISLNSGGGVANGGAISSWAGETNTNADWIQSFGSLPTYNAVATPSGTPAISFQNGSLYLPAANSPVTGQNFSVALVFETQTNGVGAPSDEWYNQTGIIDAKAFGTSDDWGISIATNGTTSFGIGNPDVTINETNYNVAGPLFHIAVVAADTLNGQLRLTVDDQVTGVSSGPVSGAARLPLDITLGSSSQAASRFFSGQIAEMRFYNGALTGAQATNLINTLKTNYAIKYPSELLVSLTPADETIGIGVTNSLSLAIPRSANASQAVAVAVTNNSPGVISLQGAVGNILTVTFPAGTTNTKPVVVTSLVAGTANLTYSSSGLLSAGPVTINVELGAPVEIPVTGGNLGQGFAPLPVDVAAVDLGGGPALTIEGVVFNPGQVTGIVANDFGNFNYNQTAAGYGFGNTTNDINMAAMLTGFTYDYSANVGWTGSPTNSHAQYQFTGLRVGKTYQLDLFTVADTNPRDTGIQVIGSITNFYDVLSTLSPKIVEYEVSPDSSGNITIGYGWGGQVIVVNASGVISGMALTTTSAPALSIHASGNQVTITWNGSGTLYEASTVTGPWTPVGGNPSSPFTTTIQGSAKFYELQ